MLRQSYEQIARLVPFKRLLPQSMRERMTSAVYDRHIRSMPDRSYLQDQLFPLLAARGARHVLFVGVRSYTSGYSALFAAQGMTLWTCDLDPVVARHGAPGRHRTLDICQVTPQSFPVKFDAVVVSGVIGWGVDEPGQINGLAERLRALLQHDDALILGWNTDRSVDPLTLDAWRDHFQPLDHAAMPNRKSFATCTHVFDLLRASRPARAISAFVAMCMAKLCHERVQAVSETLIYV